MGIFDALPTIHTSSFGRLARCLLSLDDKDSKPTLPPTNRTTYEKPTDTNATLYVYDHFQDKAKDGPSFDYDCLRAQVNTLSFSLSLVYSISSFIS